jgi:hypothetical protein
LLIPTAWLIHRSCYKGSKSGYKGAQVRVISRYRLGREALKRTTSTPLPSSAGGMWVRSRPDMHWSKRILSAAKATDVASPPISSEAGSAQICCSYYCAMTVVRVPTHPSTVRLDHQYIKLSLIRPRLSRVVSCRWFVCLLIPATQRSSGPYFKIRAGPGRKSSMFGGLNGPSYFKTH